MAAPDPSSTPVRNGEPAHARMRDYALAVAALMLGLTLLVLVLLSQQRVRVILLQVLPVVLCSIAASATVGLWLLRGALPAAWRMLVAGAGAGLMGVTFAMALVASAWGRNLGDVLGRTLVVKGLLAGPLLGALVCLVLLVLARWRRAEYNAWEMALEHRVASERLQHERALADLRLLQAQLEPHFLYNTLANLRQLIRLDSQRALALLEHLIRYFKLVLPSFQHERVALGSELALVRAYVELFHERMEPPPQLLMAVPQDLQSQPVLPGAVLCLAENALKHGRPRDGEALRLRVSALRDGETLRIDVHDNGPGLQGGTGAESTGTGLRNLRDRLRLSYRRPAAVELREDDLGCIATLTLPWETP